MKKDWFFHLPLNSYIEVSQREYMINTYKIVSKLPISERIKLEWTRSILERSFEKEIKSAQRIKDWGKVEELKREHEFEMGMHREEEDQYYTKTLLYQARKLRVPIPRYRNEFGEEMPEWYKGSYTGVWLLTDVGTSSIRKEIRAELKERHEAKARWVVWVSALTGIIGSATGLVAILSNFLV